MGSICWGWKEGSRTLHSDYRSWSPWTCPTSVCLCPSSPESPSSPGCCRTGMPARQPRTPQRRRARSQCRWTAKTTTNQSDSVKKTASWSSSQIVAARTYPSPRRVCRAVSFDCSVLIEVLSHRQPQKDGNC